MGVKFVQHGGVLYVTGGGQRCLLSLKESDRVVAVASEYTLQVFVNGREVEVER